MDQARELDAGDVSGTRKHAVEVPDRLLCLWEMIGEKPAAVVAREEAVEAPLAFAEGADVEDVDHQQIAGLRPFDADRTAEKMHLGQIDVTHVLGVVVILDLSAGPVIALDDEVVARLDLRHHRNVRVPAVVDHVIRIRRFTQIDGDQFVGHCSAPALARRSRVATHPYRTQGQALHTRPARNAPFETPRSKRCISNSQIAGDLVLIDLLAQILVDDVAVLQHQ